MWNFWRGTTNYPPPSSLSPSLSMVYWSICILGGSIVPVLKSIVLVERDCANTIVQYSIIVKLSIIVSNHCPCQSIVLVQTIHYCHCKVQYCHCQVVEYWTIALVCRQRMQLADNLTWQAGKWDPDISSFHKMRKGRKGNARKEFEILWDQRV